MSRRTALWALLFALPLVLLSAFGGTADAATAALPLDPSQLTGLLAIGAVGKVTDMVIYQAEFQTGLVERITQVLAGFNAASRNAIRLVPRALIGHYGKEAFFKDVANLVTRRDITSTSGVTPLALTQDENISVKVNRKVGPVAQTLDAIAKAGMSEADASRAFGVMAADHKLRDMLNTGLRAAEAAISGVAANNLDITGETVKTSSTSALQRAAALMGDNSQRIVAWVQHSKPYHDVTLGLLAQNVTGLTDLVTLQGAIPATLGRPSVMTDSPALTDANGSAADSYNTLGLVEDAIVVEESETERFHTDITGLNENLQRYWQAEYAYNVKVRGFKWDVTNGGINPSDAALATASNWDKVVGDDKLIAGVRLVTL